MKIKNNLNRSILAIALPSIVSNITVPLLGLVDTAIVGHLGAPAYIGAIAVGGMLFNMVYWLCGFLRMGTGGLVAQAYGAGATAERYRLLFRSLGVAGLLSLSLWLFQQPLLALALSWMNASAEVSELATLYFRILIWGAPAVLGLYSFTGWFLGSQNARFPMWVAIVQNCTNILVSLALVWGWGWKVEGVATGTLVAQYAGIGTALLLWWRCYGQRLPQDLWAGIWQRERLLAFFRINRDIFLRTFCLVAVTTCFTAWGAAQGDVVLAVNALLMQLFVLFSYVMDGFAYAGEALGGRYYGARDRRSFTQLVACLFRWGWGLVLAFTLVYLLGGSVLLRLLTDDATVISAASTYFPYAVLIPLVGFSAFLYDGIFIGCTYTRGMLVAMVGAAAVFFLVGSWGTIFLQPNHALWTAFLLYLLVRGLIQWQFFKRKLVLLLP